MDFEKKKPNFVERFRATINQNKGRERTSFFKKTLAAVTRGFDEIHTDVYGDNKRGVVNHSDSRRSSRDNKKKSSVKSGVASKKLSVGAGMRYESSNAARVSQENLSRCYFFPGLDEGNQNVQGKNPVTMDKKSSSSRKIPLSGRKKRSQKSSLYKVSNVPFNNT